MPEPTLTAETVLGRIHPRRRVEGISAVLLPFADAGQPDYDGLAAHIARTADAGLTPAVNMDTGYVDRLSPSQRAKVLHIAKEVLGNRPFVAGAFVQDQEGDLVARYRDAVEAIETLGGRPILFQCSELAGLSGPEVVAFYRQVSVGSQRLLAFELSGQFAPFGRIHDLDTVRGLLEIEAIAGLKHSSLDRRLEWQRLALRDRIRPEFKIYTGNDLAIDMVMYGSDYLLGLSTFSPSAFALRDRLWTEGDARFYALNDLPPFHPGTDGVGQPEEVSTPYPFAFGADPASPLALDLDEPVRFLSLLQDLGVELVNLTAGNPYVTPHITRPARFPPSDGYQPPEDPLVSVARQVAVCAEPKRQFPGLAIVGSAYTYLQEWLPHVAQHNIRTGRVDFVRLGRMLLSYPSYPADVLAGQPPDRKRLCRTFSDCTTAPRHGLVSGCYPLDPFYKGRGERERLAAIKARLKEAD